MGGRERPHLNHSQTAKPSAIKAKNSSIHSTGAGSSSASAMIASR